MHVCPDGSPVQTQELATTLSKCAWLQSQLCVQAANIYIRKQKYTVNKNFVQLKARTTQIFCIILKIFISCTGLINDHFAYVHPYIILPRYFSNTELTCIHAFLLLHSSSPLGLLHISIHVLF